MIPKSFIVEITRKTNIESLVSEYVVFGEVGSQLKGKCPFCHQAAFTISGPKQIYKCFRCSRGGGVISFVQEIEKKTFREAIQFLANRLGVPVPEQDRE